MKTKSQPRSANAARRRKPVRRVSAGRSRVAAHRMIDELPDNEFEFAARFLAFLKQQSAPDDDDTLTPEEEADLAESYAEVARGEVHQWSEVRKELGL